MRSQIVSGFKKTPPRKGSITKTNNKNVASPQDQTFPINPSFPDTSLSLPDVSDDAEDERERSKLRNPLASISFEKSAVTTVDLSPKCAEDDIDNQSGVNQIHSRLSRQLSAFAMTSALEEEETTTDFYSTGAIVLSFLIFVCWLALGTTFYCIHNKWTPLEGVYYTLQAGLSVGFGTLQETDDSSKLVTVFVVFTGSSVIAFVLGMFLEIMIKIHDRYAAHIKQIFQSADDDDDGEVNFAEFTLWLKRAGEYDKIGAAHAYLLFQKLDSDGSGTLDRLEFEYWVKGQQEVTTCQRFIRMIKSYKVYWVFGCWLAVGTIYGIAAEDWSFIRSLYYAMTCCSTAGLQKPPRNPSSLMFTTFYIMIGIPLYAVVLGSMAAFIGGKLVLDQELHKLQVDEEKKCVDYMKFLNVFDGDKAELNYTDFLQLELLRRGYVDTVFLHDVRKAFNELDVDNSGDLTLNELRNAMPGIERLCKAWEDQNTANNTESNSGKEKKSLFVNA